MFEALEPPARIRESTWEDKERRRIEEALATTVAGTATTVRRRLEQIAERTGAAEILSTGSTYDRAALADSDARLAALLR